MVRLKVIYAISMQIVKSYFNSTMVRLKDEYRLKCFQSLLPFQFHNGSIKRQHPIRQQQPEAHFNSTMVRLKDKFRDHAGHHHNYFNSTMVRLKAVI